MRIIIIHIPLFKWEWFSLSFVFRQAGQLPCAFVQIRHLPPWITRGRVCANPTIFGSVQIRPEKFLQCADPTMNFPKNSSNPMLRINPVELTRICANPTWVYLCESDKIFVTSIGECVIVRVWGEVERSRKIWGNCERGACLVRSTWFAGILGKSWEDLG